METASDTTTRNCSTLTDVVDSLDSAALFAALEGMEPFNEFQELAHPTFELSAFLNVHFNTEEELLLKGPSVLTDLRTKLKTLDVALASLARAQTSILPEADQLLTHFDESRKKAADTLRSVETQSVATDTRINALCWDVRELHKGKNNLGPTVDNLKRLTMLVICLDRLRSLAAEREYTHLLGFFVAANSLVFHFHTLPKLPNRVQELIDSYKHLVRDLRTQLKQDFNSIFYFDDKAVPPDLPQACRLVDAIDHALRMEILGSMSQQLLSSYYQMFPAHCAPLDPEGALNTVERRFNWLKRLLREFPDRYGVHFLHSWAPLQFLCVQFCRVVRAQLVDILGLAHADPSTLVESLTKTRDFEQYLTTTLSGELFTVSGAMADLEHQEENELATSIDGIVLPHVPYPDLLRGTLDLHRTTAFLMDPQNSNPSNTRPPHSPTETNINYVGLISACFDAFMMPWVRSEERRFQVLVQTSMANDTILFDSTAFTHDVENETDDDSQPLMFSSIVDTLAAMKQTFQCCVAACPGQPFFDIFRVFQRILLTYIEALALRVPCRVTPPYVADLLSPTRPPFPMADASPLGLCGAILGTVAYLESTLPKMSTAISRAIDSQSQEHIDFSQADNALLSVKSSTISVLLAGVQHAITEAFAILSSTRVPHSNNTLPDSSSQSSSPPPPSMAVQFFTEWTPKLSNRLIPFFEALGTYVSPALYRLISDLFLQWFLKRLSDDVFHPKNIRSFPPHVRSHILSILTDMHQILLTLPSRSPLRARPSAMYERAVHQAFQHIKTLLEL